MNIVIKKVQIYNAFHENISTSCFKALCEPPHGPQCTLKIMHLQNERSKFDIKYTKSRCKKEHNMTMYSNLKMYATSLEQNHVYGKF